MRGHGADQRLGIGGLGAAQNLFRRSGLDDLAAMHDRDAVGNLGDDAHVVGDEQDADAAAVGQVAQELEDLRLHRHVERRRRFVGDQEPGIAR